MLLGWGLLVCIKVIQLKKWNIDLSGINKQASCNMTEMRWTVWLSSSLFLPFLEENSCFRSLEPVSSVAAGDYGSTSSIHLSLSVGWIIWVSDTNGEVASRLRKYTEKPAEPPTTTPQFSFSLSHTQTHTHTYGQTCSAYSVSLSLFQCSVKRVILSSFTYLREEFPALVMIRHRSSLIKRRKSSPKLTNVEILQECSFLQEICWMWMKDYCLQWFKKKNTVN